MALVAGAGAEPEAVSLTPNAPSAPSSVYTSATLPGSSSTLSTLAAPRSLKNSIELGSVSVRSTPTMVGPGGPTLAMPSMMPSSTRSVSASSLGESSSGLPRTMTTPSMSPGSPL